MSSQEESMRLLKLKKLQLEKEKLELYRGLPHISRYPFYSWSRKFFESTNSMNFLSAANQISKSSTMIRKCIEWATNTDLWPKLWRNQPTTFWYFYPDFQTATHEFDQKWIKEFLPQDKDHSIYGWSDVRDQNDFIKQVDFRSGISVYFKAYSQKVKNLQAASLYAVFADEEMPLAFYDEIKMRMAATDGYFHMVFTPTLNQPFWAQTMMPDLPENEKFPDAFKLQVSMYDCLEYEDGSPTPWTREKIAAIEASCSSDTEIARRVHGMFITEEGRDFPHFDSGRHYTPVKDIPATWLWYSGTDIGSGGKTGHPASVLFLAVRPDYRFGYVVRSWRGDGVETTSSDILKKFRELRGNKRCVAQAYDWAGKDFALTVARENESFHRANKDHNFGVDLVNTLFQNDMLLIFDTAENRKLGLELTTNMRKTPKRHKKDDLCDALRYAAGLVPWHIDVGDSPTEEEIVEQIKTQADSRLTDREKRLKEFKEGFKGDEDGERGLEDEIDFWNSNI